MTSTFTKRLTFKVYTWGYSTHFYYFIRLGYRLGFYVWPFVLRRTHIVTNPSVIPENDDGFINIDDWKQYVIKRLCSKATRWRLCHKNNNNNNNSRYRYCIKFTHAQNVCFTIARRLPFLWIHWRFIINKAVDGLVIL